MVPCLGSLVQSCCGEGGALQTNITGVCGENSQCSSHTGFAPAAVCVLSPSTLLRIQVALQGAGSELHALPRLSRSGSGCRVLHKDADSVGLAFCAFLSPRSSGSQELDERTLPGCSASYPLRGPRLSFRAHQFRAPCVSSGELVSSCNPLCGRQPSRISGTLWLETGSLFAVW